MPLQLEIVSPERRAYSDEVDMVTVPGIDGELGILPHHTRLISALGIGELRIKKAGTEQILLISRRVRGGPGRQGHRHGGPGGALRRDRRGEGGRGAQASRGGAGEVHDPMDMARVRAALQTALMRERIATRRRSRG